ncbi:hypothetical protein [Bacillus sp. FJAT-49736]|uniref:hypothetical protein n=1 Tax=Bacillus sp. FJAT-49736 TaxID=2833582 RepID=UPI001BCA4B87|nr:hypothetical protein [Bacillus sp. FJAT-49736]MBS4175046.1 hypothetical protein [Bacillus sp. FJAT-49736]
MATAIETLYYLNNPERDITTIITETQLRYEDIIKEVFGVACESDLIMMIKFNKKFRDSICNKYGVTESEISLDMIFRIATEEDIKHYTEH